MKWPGRESSLRPLESWQLAARQPVGTLGAELFDCHCFVAAAVLFGKLISPTAVDAAVNDHQTTGSRAISRRALLIILPQLIIDGSTPTPT